MLPLGKFPVSRPDTILKQALEEMGRSRLGIICITTDDGVLQGIFTDGDVRRKLLQIQKPFSALFNDDVIDHAVLTPIIVRDTDSLIDAVNLMEEKEVWDLPVIDANNVLVGLLHLHPVVRAFLMDIA